MRKHKKVIFIVLAAVLVVGLTLGAVAIAQANDLGGFLPQSGNVSLYQKISDIYKANTGTAIDPTQLQTAFQQAQQQLATEARDAQLQKLVAAGKITQKQADDYKSWLNSMPSNALTDQYKQWLQSKPQGLPFGGPGMSVPGMPNGFGGGMMGRMFRR
jgi:hypothetical protein